MQKLLHVKGKALYLIIICFLLSAFACSPALNAAPTPMPSQTVTSVPSPTNAFLPA